MFDGRQRVVVCNKLYADLYGLTPEQVKPGTTIHQLLRSRYEKGLFGPVDFEAFAIIDTDHGLVVKFKLPRCEGRA